MAAAGSGAVLSSGYTLLIYDGEGNLSASVAKPQPLPAPPGFISPPVVGKDGGIYFADAGSAYRVDGSGQPVWQKPLEPNQSQGGEFGNGPGSPLLDGSGRLYVPALDGNLWIFGSEDGRVVSTFSLGLRDGRSPRSVDVGVGSVMVIDRTGLSAAGPAVASHGMFSTNSGTWVGEVLVGTGTYPPYVFAGYEIGFVISGAVRLTPQEETTEVFVLDRCGQLRWRVPGSNAIPLAITFDDDLIVMDRVPTGTSSASSYNFSLRRFSRDGVLVAGPVSVADQFCGRFFVGADDTFYYAGGASDGYRLRAFDSSLRELWSTQFPHCPDAAVLGSNGRIFTARALGAQFAAVQTTSPGPAPVSWGQVAGDARATRWLSP